MNGRSLEVEKITLKKMEQNMFYLLFIIYCIIIILSQYISYNVSSNLIANSTLMINL